MIFFPTLSQWHCILVYTEILWGVRGILLRGSWEQAAIRGLQSPVLEYTPLWSDFPLFLYEYVQAASAKPSYTCSKYSFFFSCIAQTGYEPDLFILTSIVVHTAKMPCTNKAYFFVWIEKFDLVRLFPSVATIPRSRREEAWDHFERCRSSVCSVLHARLVTNTMRLGDGGSGRGRSCVAMTI